MKALVAGLALVLAAGWMILNPLSAAPLATTFAQAHDAYRAKDYPKALELYRQVAATTKNAVVHYDLGCAAFKAGNVGEAIWNFEKARRLAPRDPDVQTNLEYARARIKDSAPEEEADLLTRLVWGPLDRVSLNEVATSISIAWWLAMAAVLASLLARDAKRRAALRLPLIGFGLLVVFLAIPFALKYHAEEMSQHAIVLAREVPVLSGPATDEIKRFVLHEGTKVRVMGRWDKWIHLALPNGENGWALAETLGTI